MLTGILTLLKIVLGFCLFSLVLGLIRPVYVLWFMDRMNRLKVIKYYGIASLLVVTLLALLNWVFVKL